MTEGGRLPLITLLYRKRGVSVRMYKVAFQKNKNEMAMADVLTK